MTWDEAAALTRCPRATLYEHWLKGRIRHRGTRVWGGSLERASVEQLADWYAQAVRERTAAISQRCASVLGLRLPWAVNGRPKNRHKRRNRARLSEKPRSCLSVGRRSTSTPSAHSTRLRADGKTMRCRAVPRSGGQEDGGVAGRVMKLSKTAEHKKDGGNRARNIGETRDRDDLEDEDDRQRGEADQPSGQLPASQLVPPSRHTYGRTLPNTGAETICPLIGDVRTSLEPATRRFPLQSPTGAI